MDKTNTMNKKKRFYVVFVGVRTGVFSSWEECSKYVLGYSGSVFRSFKLEEEAIVEYRAYTKERLGDMSCASSRDLQFHLAKRQKRRFYVVLRGRQIDIYGSWEECASHVQGYNGSLFRAFKSEEEAIAEYNWYFGSHSVDNALYKENTSTSTVVVGEVATNLLGGPKEAVLGCS